MHERQESCGKSDSRRLHQHEPRTLHVTLDFFPIKTEPRDQLAPAAGSVSGLPLSVGRDAHRLAAGSAMRCRLSRAWRSDRNLLAAPPVSLHAVVAPAIPRAQTRNVAGPSAPR